MSKMQIFKKKLIYMELKISKNDVISVILSFLKHERERTVKVFHYMFLAFPTVQLYNCS